MAEPREDLGPLAGVVALAREAAGAKVSGELHALGRQRLAATAAGRTAEVTPRRPLAIALLAAAVAVAMATGALVFFRTRPLEYVVRGAGNPGSSYVAAGTNAASHVEFSDGSVVVLAPSARLRVGETTRDGARMLLERGEATARVAHRSGSRWVFTAGPFEIRVTGTRFAVSWDPSKEEIDLTLHEGSVDVESPVGPNRIAVRAGQRFRASLQTGAMTVEKADGSPALPTPAPAAALPSPPATATAVHLQAPSAASREPDTHAETWSELVRRGEFAAVVSAGKARGVEGCLGTCDAGELRALADAARYTGEAAIAEQSLSAIRRRFAGTPKSAAATFLLGRLSESSGRLEGADNWYRTYLGEAPSGEFAADALAGRMRLASAAKGAVAARSLALEYLERYPNGVHASAAKALVVRD